MNLKNKHVLAVYRALRVRLDDMRADPAVDGANAVIAESLYDLATEGNVLELYKLGRGLNQDVQKLRTENEGLRKQLETLASEGATVGRFDIEVTAEKTTRKLAQKPVFSAETRCCMQTVKGTRCKNKAKETDSEQRRYCASHWRERADLA